MFSKETTGFIQFFVRRYPARTALLVALLFLAGLAEGFGAATLLPALEAFVGNGTESPSALTETIQRAISAVGLTPRMEVLLAAVVLALVLKGGFRLLAMRQVGYTVSRVSTDLRLLLIGTLLRTRWGYFVSQPAGRFASAIGMEANRTSQAYRGACTMLAALIQASFYAAVALTISWRVALLALAGGALTTLALSRLVSTSRAAGREQTLLMKSLSARLIDALHGIKPVKAMGREGHFQSLLENETRGINRTQEKQVLASEALLAAQEPIMVVLLAVILYVSVGVYDEPVSSMLVLGFLFYRLAGRLGEVQLNYQSIAAGESAFWSLQESIRAAERLREPQIGTLPPPPMIQGIEVCNVSFGYGEQMVLKDVSLTIPAGQMVSLVGPSGAGKTTLADIIVGLYQPARGEVLVDDVPLQEIDTAGWRQTIGYVPQEMFLFHDTILANLTLGDPAITREDVEDALKAAGIWEFVAELPQGVETVMGERGSRLSGGQRQRLAIARALARKPRLLILDEVTTALDPRTEAAICRTLRALRGRVTILSISHQPAMMEAADVVYRIEDGTAVRMDHHPSLPLAINR